jgi:hypothetical protein
LAAIDFKNFLEGQGNHYLVNSIGHIMFLAWMTVGFVLDRVDFKVEQIPWLPPPIVAALYLAIVYITVVGLMGYEMMATRRELIAGLFPPAIVGILLFVWWGIRKGWFQRSGE